MAPVRDRLAERHPEVERVRPAVLDDVAELVVGVAEALHGRASATAGVRSAAYRRQQLRGEHSISLTDLCQLAQDAPEAEKDLLVRIARILSALGGYKPAGQNCVELHSEIRGVARRHEVEGVHRMIPIFRGVLAAAVLLFMCMLAGVVAVAVVKWWALQ